MRCSLAMISDSASVARLQLWPALSSAVDMTANPMPSATVGLVVDPAARAVRDEELVVELGLRSPGRPPLAGLVENRDLVLVAVLISGLDPDDERHRLAGLRRRRGDVRRRVLAVVGVKLAVHGRLVLVLIGRWRIALRSLGVVLADPGVYLRAGEDRASGRVVSNDGSVGGCARRGGGEDVPSHPHARDQAL